MGFGPLLCFLIWGKFTLFCIYFFFILPQPRMHIEKPGSFKVVSTSPEDPQTQSCSLQDTGVPATLEMPLIRQSATGQLNQFLVVNLYLCFYFSLGEQLYKRLGPGWNWNKVILFQHPFTYAVRWRAFPKLLA